MRLVPYLCGLTLAPALFACSSTPATTTTITRPELIQVSPDDFLGSQRCGDDDGQGVDADDPALVRSYVATLFDVTTNSDGGPLPETGFPLPSSPPTACKFPVTFSFVLVDHRYRAEIDAYNLPPQSNADDAGADDAGADDAGADDAGADDAGADDAGPDGGARDFITAVSAGGRLQQDGITGAHVAPRWTALCGGYPPTDPDAGLGAGATGVPTPVDSSDAGDAAPPGVVSYDTLTSTVHNCGNGLQPVK